MLLATAKRRTLQVRATSRALSSIAAFLRMNAIGSGSSRATAARWTIPVIWCRSPMARRVSRSARSACSTTTRPSRKDGGAALRCRVTTTSSPRSASASAAWAPIEPNPPVTRIIAAGPGPTEVGVHRGYDDGPFSDGGGDSLDGAGADVADGEQPGHGGREAIPGRHEALGVELDPRVLKPCGPRHGADHQEHATGLEPDVLLLFSPRDFGQTLLAVDRRQVRPGVDGDPVVVGESLREIAGHGLGEVVTADEDVHVVDLLREEQRGLPGRVGASHHHHVLADACPRLELGRGVVDAATLELGETWDLQSAVLHAAGDDDGPGGDVVLVVEADLEPVRVARQSGHRPGRDEPGPELDRLQHRRPGQLAAGDAAWEAEVVLDPRRRAGLPSQGDTLGDDDIEPFGGPVDGSGQARRAGADDQQVAMRLVGQPGEVQSDGGGQIAGRRLREDASPSGDHGRSRLRERARRGDLGPRGRIRAQHRPIGHVIALGELLQPVHVAIVVAGEDQATLSPAAQHAPPRVEGGEHHVAQLRGGRHEPSQVRDGHPQQRGVRHGDAGEERRLPHQHAELADEVAGFDHEPDPATSSVHETDPAGEDEVEVVCVARIPQRLTGLGSDHLADRLQQRPALVIELGPRLDLDLIRSLRRVAGPLVGRWGGAGHGLHEKTPPWRGISRSAPERTRTSDLRFRRPTLYPTELRALGHCESGV